MNIGTKSVLYGAHCFFIHPWFVAYSWWKLYGFPWDPRLWIAFFVHDLGYWGKPNMDGPEGETDVEWGANLMDIFGPEWYRFTLYHSRFYAKKNKAQFSKLCVADKLAICSTWRWLYLLSVNLTGEVKEYMALADKMNELPLGLQQKQWHEGMTTYVRKWVSEYKDIKPDTWTQDKTKGTSSGVWL
jgi:hypothetical protein